MRSRQYGRFAGTEILPALILAVSPLIVGIDYLDQYRKHEQKMEADPVYREHVMQEREQERERVSELGKTFVECYAAARRIPFLDKLFSD